MIEISTELDEEVPKWDVALESMAKDHFHQQGRDLTIEDFRYLANKYAIRFDDIMVTIFELTIHRRWRYSDRRGVTQLIDRNTLDALYVNGRLAEADVKEFDGGWAPLV